MEAVWLTGPAFTLHDGRGCLSFEVKGDNDATVLLKQQTGSRRWQHLAGGGAAANGAAAANGRGPSPVEQNYTVILGSHRNSCLKFEKDGELCCMVANPPGAGLSSSTFTRYWINYDQGCISVGRGPPGEGLCASWSDPEPISNIRFAGLSAWDKHVGYRNLRMHPALQPPPSSPSPRQQRAHGDLAQPWPQAASQQEHQSSSVNSSHDGQPGARQLSESAVPSLLDQCQAALLSDLSAGSVCEVLQVADCLSPVVDGLRSRAVEHAAQHFQCVVGQDLPGFCSLSTACLVDILCCESLDCPEKEVFDAVMKWAGYGREVADDASACHPMQDLEQLLPCIRFPLMRDSELELVRQHAMWGRSSLLRELLQEALDARSEEGTAREGSPRGGVAARRAAVSLTQDARHVRALTHSERLASSRFQMRRAPGCTELIYMFDGDRNGVCWHLGTCGGTQPWVNPVLAGRLQVRASSPACRSTDPRALVGHNFARCNFAGPRMENGQPSSWWVLDLGPRHQLICNYYTLRHDGSADFLRSWVLQGSNDGASWADLRRHLGDSTLCKAGQYASWPVAGHAAAVPYRYFRVLQVAPNPEAANPHHVCLSFWELYGYLYQRKEQEGQARPHLVPHHQIVSCPGGGC
ncbi:hypothetical protein ABPG77_007515 [Micractinium sp. CCAP 211/92]